MRYIYNVRMAVVACSALLAMSCTDYLDYNTVPEATNPAADKTLWENIAENENLTDFAAILKSMGYDEVLNAAHTYTVWAPMNGSFNVEELNQMDASKVERQFLKNAIADYAHRETDINDTVVYMLNGKLVKFTNKNTGMLAFDGKEILPNEALPSVFNYPCTNGLLYIASEPATFRYNGYEYLRESEEAPSMMAAYVAHYESRVLDEANSVKGAIVDGIQHYDDSVIIVSNMLTDRMLRAQLDNEDSLYTVLIPTDTAWKRAYERIASYYNYVEKIPYQDLTHSDVGLLPGATWNSKAKNLIDIMDAAKGKIELTLAAAPIGSEILETGAYWSDSVAKRLLTNNFVFSETNRKYNAKLQTGQSFNENDTLYSTTGQWLSNPTKLNELTEEVIQLSNGHARVINDYPFDPKETYAPIIKSRKVGRVITATGYKYTEESIDRTLLDPSICVLDDEDETALRYVKTNVPDFSSALSEFNFYLDNVLSTTYDVSLVLVPACIENPEMPESERKPYSIFVDINYADYVNGELKLVTGRFDGETVVPAVNDKGNANTSGLRNLKAFTGIAKEKVDTVKLGRVTFPICYAGTDARPNIKVMYPFNMMMDKSCERNLRIANIILEPVKEEE
ncbi:MAG: fasciclin domain-containing protein [Bacteroidaceae bacterium]|nr:fasciclin domain-containing protein [Bacteroidaceae bacterium]